MPVGSLAVRCLVYPATLVKTRLQAEPSPGELPYRGTADAFRRIVRAEGPRALYKGFGVSLLGLGVGPVYLTGFETTRTWVTSATAAWAATGHPAAAWLSSRTAQETTASLAGGIAASLVAQTIVVPIDIVSQVRMMQRSSGPAAAAAPAATVAGAGAASAQAAGGAAPAGTDVRSIVSWLLRTQGVRGLYTGYSVSLMTYAPNSAVLWAVFGAAQRRLTALVDAAFPRRDASGAVMAGPVSVSSSSSAFDGAERSVPIAAASGLVAGVVGGVVTNPLDVVRARLQLAHADMRAAATDAGAGMAETPMQATIRSTVRDLIREHGVAGFGRGMVARIMSSAPSSALIMSMYELLKRASRLDTHDDGDGEAETLGATG